MTNINPSESRERDVRTSARPIGQRLIYSERAEYHTRDDVACQYPCRGQLRVVNEQLPDDAALCLYAGLREEYAAPDNTRCLATRDIRLARRLVRDCLFRGHGAAFTLGLWGKVCAGEDQYIKPFKPRADLLLDTTHTYEVCLWHALLDTMPPDEDLTATQRRQLDTLRARFAAFPPLDTALVPADSMLREFIGE